MSDELQRPSEEAERRDLRWLADVRANGITLERVYAKSVINTLAWFEQNERKYREALEALNTLRSNIVATQSASWANTVYPLVAILNATGLEQFDPTEEQLREHVEAYGGAGGYPGHTLREPYEGWREPVSRLQSVEEGVRQYLENPTDKNRAILEARMEKR